MASKPDYTVGLASLAVGGTTITFSDGASLGLAGTKPGDTFHAQNLEAIIVDVPDSTHAVISSPWTGTALVAAPYRLRTQPDGSSLSAATRELIELLGNGNLQSIANSSGTEGQVLTIQGGMAKWQDTVGYATGIVVPTFNFSTPGNTSVSYTSSKQWLRWTRIGNRCMFDLDLECTPTFSTASGAYQISGLPFIVPISAYGPGDDGQRRGPHIAVKPRGIPMNDYIMNARLNPGTNNMWFSRIGKTGAGADDGVFTLASASIASGTTIRFQINGMYEVE